MTAHRPTSYLFVPATRPERIAKAFASGAGAVILDLEDAVAAADKDSARETLRSSLQPERRVIVRINGAGSEWFERDLALCRHAGVAAVMLPKAESSVDLRTVHEHCDRPVLALIETARGVWNALEVASTPGVQRLAFGALDFRLDLGLPDAGYAQLAPYRARLVLASRVANLAPPIDSPTPGFDDLEHVRAESIAARQLGFGGKLCIHPRQVGAVNAAFQPTPAEVQWAQKVLAAFEASNGAATAVDGKMIDKPVVERARRIAAEAPAP